MTNDSPPPLDPKIRGLLVAVIYLAVGIVVTWLMDGCELKRLRQRVDKLEQRP